MWVFTRYGFFSAVCAKVETGAVSQDTLQIRARELAHLEALKLRFPDLIGDREIITSEHTDYRFRISCSKKTWSQLMLELSEDINYSNFKNEVMDTQGPTGYEKALHDVWATMYRLQPARSDHLATKHRSRNTQSEAK